MPSSQSEAKTFLVEAIVRQTLSDAHPLSESERWMLRFSEGDPEFDFDWDRLQQFEAEIDEAEYETKIFEVHTLFIVLVLALSSMLLLTSSDALIEPSRLSRAPLLGLTAFWGLRMLMQWFYYSPAIWRGDRFNTAAHCVFSIVWIYLTAIFAVALWSNLSQR